MKLALLTNATLAALSGLLASTGWAQPGDPAVPLSEREVGVANAVPDEGNAPPEESYTTSNEWRHDLYYEHIRDVGGAFVGVGTDPCYTLAAYQNASVVWLIDYDPVIPLLHRIYGVLIEASDSPEALLERFTEASFASSRALLEAALDGDPLRRRLVGLFRANRGGLHRYLSRVRRSRYRSWLSDPELYRRVRVLHRNHRVIARNGDVTANGALRAVGAAAHELGVPVRVLYLSNAEEFFRYEQEFRTNLAALPADGRSVVLRTLRNRALTYPDGDDWHYVVQPLSDFRARIVDAGYRRSRQMLVDLVSHPAAVGPGGVSVLNASVPRAESSPQ